ncbi:TolC family protein [Herbaspirillum huttiense]|uniref:TolC family protein n=1 Tax=Herbaspirillum huttiense TaxID=863372 RepID=UPI0031D2302F
MTGDEEDMGKWMQIKIHSSSKTLWGIAMILLWSVSTGWALDMKAIDKSVTKVVKESAAQAADQTPAQRIVGELLDRGTVDIPVTMPLEAPEDGVMPTTTDPVGSITLAEAIDSTYEGSPEVGAQAAAAKANRWVARSSLGKLGPKLDVEYSRGREHSSASGDAANVAPVVLPYHTRTDQSMVLRQPVMDLQAVAAWKRDDRLADAENAKLSQTRVSVAFDVSSAYYDLVQYQLLVMLAKEQFVRTGNLLNYMTRRAAGGGATLADRERVRAASLNANRDLLDARSQLSHAQMTFARLTNRIPTQLVVTQENFREMPATAEQAMERMLTNSPSLMALRQQMEAAAYDRKSTQAGVLPKFELQLGDYRSSNASGTPGSTRDARVMLTMRMNLFNGGSEYAVSQAQAQQQVQLREQYEDTLRKARERFQTNYLNLAAIRRQASIAREEVRANVTVADAFDAQFATANRPLLDVLTAYEKLYASRVSLIKLFVSERRAVFQIFKDTGDMTNLDFARMGS